MSARGWVGFVSGRFIRNDRTKIMLIVAVAVSVATLICVLSIMNGLQFLTITNLIEIDSYHVTVREPLTTEQQEEIHSVLDDDQRFQSAVSFAELQTVAHSESSDLQGVSIRAVNRNDVQSDRGFIEQLNIVRGTFDISENRVLIGTPLAYALQIGVGDEVRIYGHSGQTHSFEVSGLFYSGYSGFDNGLTIMSVQNARASINDSIPIHMGIKYRDVSDEAVLADVVRERVAQIIGRDPMLLGWRQSNTVLFSALKLEKIFIVFILGMIFIIVAINIRQSLARKVRQYARELAVLQAVGAPAHKVRLIITCMGVYIGIIGGVFGVLMGLWLSLNVNAIFSMADTIVNGAIRILNSIIIITNINAVSPLSYISSAIFFIGAVERRLLLRECIIIFSFAVVTSWGAAYFASKQSTTVQPVRALRKNME